jgi:hypothetical protein
LRGGGNHGEEDYGGDYLSHIINLRRQKYILFLKEIFCTFAFQFFRYGNYVMNVEPVWSE